MWLLFFFFKQKTAYEMRISDWSSDVCSSDLPAGAGADVEQVADPLVPQRRQQAGVDHFVVDIEPPEFFPARGVGLEILAGPRRPLLADALEAGEVVQHRGIVGGNPRHQGADHLGQGAALSRAIEGAGAPAVAPQNTGFAHHLETGRAACREEGG